MTPEQWADRYMSMVDDDDRKRSRGDCPPPSFDEVVAGIKKKVSAVIRFAVEEERDGLNQDYEFTFTPREQWIIRLFLNGLEIEEVSAQIGSPIERVQQIKAKIIKKLEHSEKLQAKRNLTSGKEGRF